MEKRLEIVKIKPEWEGDDSEYVVIEDNGDRILISPINSGMAYPPTELVRRYMIDTVSVTTLVA